MSGVLIVKPVQTEEVSREQMAKALSKDEMDLLRHLKEAGIDVKQITKGKARWNREG